MEHMALQILVGTALTDPQFCHDLRIYTGLRGPVVRMVRGRESCASPPCYGGRSSASAGAGRACMVAVIVVSNAVFGMEQKD